MIKPTFLHKIPSRSDAFLTSSFRHLISLAQRQAHINGRTSPRYFMTKGVEKFYSLGVLKKSRSHDCSRVLDTLTRDLPVDNEASGVRLRDLWRDEVALAK
jgi:hypothetical protein